MNAKTNVSDSKYEMGDVSLNLDNRRPLRYLIFAVTIPGILWNGFLLVCFYRNRNAAWIRKTKSMICNIINDFVISILNTVLALAIIPEELQWPLELCYVRNYFTVTLQCISLNHILSMCFDRFRIAVKLQNLQQSDTNSYKRSAAIWTCTLLFGLLPFFIQINRHEERSQKCSANTVALELSPKSVLLVHTFMTLVPWFITNVLFIVTSVILWRKMRKVEHANSEAQHADRIKTSSYIRRAGDVKSGNKRNSYSTRSETASCQSEIKSTRNEVFCLPDKQKLSLSELKDSPVYLTEKIKQNNLSLHLKQGESVASSSQSHQKGFSNAEGLLHSYNSEQNKKLSNVLKSKKDSCSSVKSEKCGSGVNARVTADNVSTDRVKKESNSQGNEKDTYTMKSDKINVRAVQNTSCINGNNQQRDAKKHVMVTILLLLIVFNISMWPVVIGLVGLQLSEPFRLEGKFYIFVFINQTLNPIIYATRIGRLRGAMKEFLRSCLNRR